MTKLADCGGRHVVHRYAQSALSDVLGFSLAKAGGAFTRTTRLSGSTGRFGSHPRGRHFPRQKVDPHTDNRPLEIRRRQRTGIPTLSGRASAQEVAISAAGCICTKVMTVTQTEDNHNSARSFVVYRNIPSKSKQHSNAPCLNTVSSSLVFRR